MKIQIKKRWKIICLTIAMIPLGFSSNLLYSQVVPGEEGGCEHDKCATYVIIKGPPEGNTETHACVPAGPDEAYKNCDAEEDGCNLTDC